MNALASLGPWFIFQFAANTGFRISSSRRRGPPHRAASFPRETRATRHRPWTRDSSVDSSPRSATAAAESPPPTMVVAPLSVAAAIASATRRVPSSNGFVSNTPMGPFQTTVFARAISFRSAPQTGAQCRASPGRRESRRAARYAPWPPARSMARQPRRQAGRACRLRVASSSLATRRGLPRPATSRSANPSRERRCTPSRRRSAADRPSGAAAR